MKIFELTVDLLDNVTGLECISLVQNPAVRINYLTFEKEKKQEEFKFDEDRHIITGVALLAEVPIYRYSPGLGEYYVKFSKQTVEDLVVKFSKTGLINKVNLQHQEGSDQEGIYMYESYLVNRERGVAPVEFPDATEGSWIVSYKVLNEDLWREIKTSGKLLGFSVETVCEMLESKFESSLKSDEEDELTNFINWAKKELS